MKLFIVQIDHNVLPSNSILVPLVPLTWEKGGQAGHSRRFWIPQLPTFHSSRADLTENSSSNFNSLASRQVERIKHPINLQIQITNKEMHEDHFGE